MKKATSIILLLTSTVLLADEDLRLNADDVRAGISNQLSSLKITHKDIQDAQVLSHYETKHNGVTHIVFRQQLNGIEVYQGDIQINLDKSGNQINLHNQFITDLVNKVNAVQPSIPADLAIMNAAQDVNVSTLMPTFMIENSGSLNQAALYSGAGISLQDIPVKLTYKKHNGQAVLAWDIQIQEEVNWWNMHVDATTGEVLNKVNWTSHASYDVIPLPHESPATNGGALETIVDPHDAMASPYGWHDTDGVIGAEFTDTRGNNVFAQDDTDGNNIGGVRPDGGAGLVFNVPWNPAVNPDEEQNLESAVVNLFYWNNVIHDIMYYYGFDEPAGNFQENNYGNGGVGSDPVNADAQDGSGTNNANFSTPPDGSNPRMQMYYYVGPPSLIVTAPAAIAGEYDIGGASFGAAYTQAGISGDVELVNDGTETTTDACQALVGFTPGKIALIDRGGCEFGLKVLNAQNAAAIGAIVVNNQGDGVLTMGGGANGGSVTITSVFLGQGNGDIIKTQLQTETVNVEIKKTTADRDSDYDNGIIIHEYGHGISNRLTGGPSTSACLFNDEQMGEGWSDYYATAFTVQPTDTSTTSRPMGTYATQNPAGIRPWPYTTDMNVNPGTFASLPLVSIPHGVGSVWTQMLWEVHWNLVNKHGYDPDLYQGTGGNNLAIQLVTDGMKLQPCNPGFVDGRDAILQADMVNNAGENQCEIWRGFAKRGLGFGASSGDTNVIGDETVSFLLPDSCDLIFEDGFE